MSDLITMKTLSNNSQMTHLRQITLCGRAKKKRTHEPVSNLDHHRTHNPRLMSAVTLSFFAILISLVVLWSPVTQGKDGPSVGEHDNSLAEYFAHPQISNLKAHCGCPPRAIKASSNLEQNVDTKACLYRVGTQVKYSCLNGHVKLSGSEHLECILKDDQALWDKDPLQCEIVDCGDPGFVQFATREGSSSTYNSHVRYRCNAGYTPVGTPFMRCDEHGNWNRKKPICKLIQCPHIDKLDRNLFIQYSDHERVVNSTVHFQCKSGFQIDQEVNARRTCNWDGNWTGQNPACVQNFCPNPAQNSLPAGVVLLPKKDRFLVGESLHYYCVTNNEYERIQCLADGSLQGNMPLCPRPQITHCLPVDLEHGQLTSSSSDRFAIGAKLTFRCDYNYKLTDPKWIVCQNNGEWTSPPPRCADVSGSMSSLILSYILTCVIFIILLILIIWFVVLFRWRQNQNQRRKYRKYFLNYDFQHDKAYLPPTANRNQELRLFFESKRLSVPFTDL